MNDETPKLDPNDWHRWILTDDNSVQFKDVVMTNPCIGTQISTIAHELIPSLTTVGIPLDEMWSSGRQKYRIATPEEVVERAYAIAEHYFKIGLERGWLRMMPPLHQMYKSGTRLGFTSKTHEQLRSDDQAAGDPPGDS